jgi:hypothetical protein
VRGLLAGKKAILITLSGAPLPWRYGSAQRVRFWRYRLWENLTERLILTKPGVMPLLIGRMAMGDQTAFSVLYELTVDRVYRQVISG